MMCSGPCCPSAVQESRLLARPPQGFFLPSVAQNRGGAGGQRAHEPISGIQSDSKPVPLKNTKWMLLDGSNRARMKITRKADLERNSLIENILGKRAHAEYVSIFNLHIFDEPRGVSYPVGAAPLNGLPDRFLSETFAGVDRDIEVFSLYIYWNASTCFFGG